MLTYKRTRDGSEKLSVPKYNIFKSQREELKCTALTDNLKETTIFKAFFISMTHPVISCFHLKSDYKYFFAISSQVQNIRRSKVDRERNYSEDIFLDFYTCTSNDLHDNFLHFRKMP